MELIKKGSHFDFMGNRWYAYIFSLTLTALSIWIWIARGDDKYGIDYRGGHEIVVKFDNAADVDSVKVQKLMAKGGFEDAVVQSFEIGSHEYTIRFRAGESDEPTAVKNKVNDTLKSAYDGKYTIEKTDSVGPSIGNELKRHALWAIGLSLIAILAYIAYRFEFAFGLGAFVALFHDVIIATGGYLASGHTLNGAALAAALTIVGYSVMDTVVIFDRVREEIFKHKDFDLKQLFNESINLMLSRTIITSGLTFFSALCLLLLGGGAIADLSLFLVVGIVAGTYSTIFIASPIVLAWDNYRQSRLKAAAAAAAGKPARQSA